MSHKKSVDDRYEICRVCGVKLKEVRGPHLRKHNLTETQYEKKYFTKEEKKERDERWKNFKFVQTVDEELAKIIAKEKKPEPIIRPQSHQLLKYINRECEKK
jgi:hypothetical protein